MFQTHEGMNTEIEYRLKSDRKWHAWNINLIAGAESENWAPNSSAFKNVYHYHISQVTVV